MAIAERRSRIRGGASTPVSEAAPATPAPNRRARMRTMAPEASTARGIPEAIHNLIKQVWVDNRTKNKATRDEKANKTKLLGAMGTAELKQCDITFKHPSEKEAGAFDTISLTAAIGTPEQQKVDPAKLRKLCTDEQFMGLVSIPKDAAEKLLGKALIAKTLYKVEGETTVTVGPKE